MIKVKTKEGVGEFIELTKKEEGKPELTNYLTTYISQFNKMVETYSWMKDRLNLEQQRRWTSTISSLRTVCLALDKGFDPVTPPRNWSSGLLFQYLAPIPEQVRKSIDLAEPIFGNQQILIYDPNPEHFQRPKFKDPMAVGFVNLAEDRLHFLIGKWDLDSDLEFIKGEPAAVTHTTRRVNEVLDLSKEWEKEFVKPPTEYKWRREGIIHKVESPSEYNTTWISSLSQNPWSRRMLG